jgi:hypothetical protein
MSSCGEGCDQRGLLSPHSSEIRCDFYSSIREEEFMVEQSEEQSRGLQKAKRKFKYDVEDF